MPDEAYIHSHHPVVVAAHSKRTAEEAAAFLLPRLEPHIRILDVGSGPDTITVGLARHVPEVATGETVIGDQGTEETRAD